MIEGGEIFMKDEKFYKLIIAFILIIPGALMVADGVMVFLGNNAIFFQVDSRFEFFVGLALLILGSKKLKHAGKK